MHRSRFEHRRERLRTASQFGRFDHRRRIVGTAAQLRDVVDPAGQIVQTPVSEVEQRLRCCCLVGELRVVELLAGPGAFAEVFEPDHARAALERVEGAPQCGQQVQVGGRVAERAARVTRVGQHLACLFEKDLAHLVVLRDLSELRARGRGCEIEPHRRAHLDARARHVEVDADRVGRGRHEIDQRLRQLAARQRLAGRVDRLFECFLGAQNGRGECRLVGGLGLVREPLEVTGHIGHRHVVAHRAERELLRLFDQALLDGCGGRAAGDLGRMHFGTAAHHRAERAGFGVVGEQRLGHLRLHAEHVDQEAERTEVAGEPVEHVGLRDAVGVDLGRGQAVDLGAHAQQRGRGVVHAQHREHAAHRGKLARHGNQHLARFGLAEVLVDQFLGFGQARAQLLHHAAHGLAIRDAAVQLLHPAFERVGRVALAHGREPVGQALHARGLFGVVEIDVVECRFDVEQAGRDFHRQLGRGRGAGLLRLRDRLLQLGGKCIAEREQFLQRFADERELLRQAGHAVHLATGDGRPRIFRGDHALPRLGDHGRVKSAECADAVVDRHMVREPVGQAHGGQTRRVAAVARRGALRAEKKQILRESLGHFGFAAREDAELREQARGDALAEHVEAQQAVGLRLEHRGSELPKCRDLGLPGTCTDTRTEPGTDLAHAACRGRRVDGAHQRQQLGFDRGLRARVGLQRMRRRVGRQIAPLPVDRPQIGRVHAVGTGGLLDRAVLREQRQRGDLLAGEQAA